MIEMLLVLWGNIHTLSVILFMTSLLALAAFGVGWAVSAGDANSRYATKEDEARAARFRTLFWGVIRASIVLSILVCIPSLDDLWRVRIALMKYRLADPANVQQAAETIERIAAKMECRYLGCEEKKKESSND